jgi:hypothetical protein
MDMKILMNSEAILEICIKENIFQVNRRYFAFSNWNYKKYFEVKASLGLNKLNNFTSSALEFSQFFLTDHKTPMQILHQFFLLLLFENIQGQTWFHLLIFQLRTQRMNPYSHFKFKKMHPSNEIIYRSSPIKIQKHISDILSSSKK